MTFRIKDFEPESIRPLIEVRDDITNRLRRQKALDRARSLAQTSNSIGRMEDRAAERRRVIRDYSLR